MSHEHFKLAKSGHGNVVNARTPLTGAQYSNGSAHLKKQLLGEGARLPGPPPWYGGCHIITMHDGKDETTMAVPSERVRLLQHRQCAFVLQFGAFQKAFELRLRGAVQL